MNELFIRALDAHEVRVRLAALPAWEARAAAWEASALTFAFFAVAAAVVLGVWPARKALPRVVSAALPLGLGLVGVVGAWIAARPRDVTAGSALSLFPELAARFDDVGRVGWYATFIAAGVLAATIVDGPAWLDRLYAQQAVRITTALLAFGAGLAVLAAARPVLDERAAIDAVAPLPALAPSEPLLAHVGQRRLVALDALSELGVRSESFLGFQTARYVVHDAGSPADLDALAARRRHRASLSGAHRAEWSLAAPVALDAPATPGPFHVAIARRRGPVEVELVIDGLAIDDAPDPAFPLVAGARWRWAQARRRDGEPVVEEGHTTLWVLEERVVDGLRTLEVDIFLEPLATTDPIATSAPPARRETLRLVPWEGTYRLAPAPDADRFVEPYEPTGREVAGLVPGGGALCRVRGLGLCTCATDPTGPRVCMEDRTDGREEVGSAVAAALTLGISVLFGARARRTLVERRLVEVDTEAIDTPSLLAPPPPAPRRRRR